MNQNDFHHGTPIAAIRAIAYLQSIGMAESFHVRQVVDDRIVRDAKDRDGLLNVMKQNMAHDVGRFLLKQDAVEYDISHLLHERKTVMTMQGMLVYPRPNEKAKERMAEAWDRVMKEGFEE